VPELHLQPQAEKDIRRLGEDASNLDIKAIVGSPGWRRLRIDTYRVCYRSAPTVSSNGE
jgi:mRNA-degrading endonuclease RelE of RelBE toxin-antitoxin system